MNPETESAPTAPAPERLTPAVTAGPMPPSRLRRALFAPLKFLLGMVFFQSPLGGLGGLGWTCRLMQRTALLQWWKAAGGDRRGVSFAAFAAADPRTREHAHWPNWVVAQNFRTAVKSASGAGIGMRLSIWLGALFGSLWTNISLGVRAAFNVWIFTLPGCVLMLFGWYDGWHNSFNKGYEQFWVGPLSGWLGIVAVIAALYHVPLAQARQAVTGNWRTFYQFRLIRTLRRRRSLATTALAGLYAVATIPVTVLAAIPMFLPNINPQLADATPTEVIATLNAFYFWAAAFLLPAFVFLHLLAARIYASALLDAVQSGAMPEDDLAEREWHALHRLDLLQVRPTPTRRTWVRVVAWAGSRAGRITLGIMSFLLWFACIGQTFIQQFFHYTGALGWLNHPLLQIPWFHRFPANIQNPWAAIGVAAGVVVAGWQLSRLARWLGSLKRG